MPNKIVFEEFIKKATHKYGNRYDYKLVNYIDYKTPIKIICPEHNIFEMTPYNHIHSRGNGCSLCSNRLQLTTEQFICKSKQFYRKHIQLFFS